MRITEVDPTALDADTADALAAVVTAAATAELATARPTTGPSLRLRMRIGSGDDRPSWLAIAYDGDRPVGVATLMFPQQSNRHLAYAWVDVDPAHQRRGIGSELFDRAKRRAADEGRRTLVAFAIRDGAGAAFATSHGFTPGQDNAVRRLDLTGVDPSTWHDHRQRATEHAPDYELVRVQGPSDESLLRELTPLYQAINDAPIGDLDMEPDPYDIASIRAYEHAMAEREHAMYRVLARRRSDGEWAGHTILLVDRYVPAWAGQEDTTVVRAHRGHRLGLAMKADLLAWLSEAEPQVRWVQTWNAESNRHMLAVNETLGFRLGARIVAYQKAVSTARQSCQPHATP